MKSFWAIGRSKRTSALILFCLGLFASALPGLNGGYCIFSVDKKAAHQSVLKKFEQSFTGEKAGNYESNCEVEDVVRSELAEVRAKWQAACSTTREDVSRFGNDKSKFYYITRCGFVSYSYSY